MALFSMISLDVTLSVPPAVQLLMAGIFFAILLLLGDSHPMLQSLVVWADTNPSAFNMEDDSSQVTVPVSPLDAA